MKSVERLVPAFFQNLKLVLCSFLQQCMSLQAFNKVSEGCSDAHTSISPGLCCKLPFHLPSYHSTSPNITIILCPSHHEN